MNAVKHNKRSVISLVTQLISRPVKQQQLYYECDITHIKQQSLIDNFKNDFNQEFVESGGRHLPPEIVNMILRSLVSPSQVPIKKSQLDIAIFNDYLEQLSSLGVKDSNQRFHLANVAMQYEFGKKIPFLRWLWFRVK